MIRSRYLAGVAAWSATCAEAHGFGQRYDLPIPLSLYLLGAGSTIVVSCVMLVLYVKAARHEHTYALVDLLRYRIGRAFVAIPVLATVRLAAVFIYFLVVGAGLFGNQNPFRNLAPIAVWAAWWVGMAYVSALVGDAWKIANPLDTIFAFAERLHARLRPGKHLSRDFRIPPWVGAWPCVVLFLVFLWMEMVWEESDHPARLAQAILGYSALTWAGMFLFGRESWTAHGEVFSRVFGILSRFAPLAIRLENRRVVEFRLRPFAVGLLNREPVNESEKVLVLAILAAVSFDGFMETPAWLAIVDTLAAAPGDAVPWARTLGLIAAPLIFLGVYELFCRLIARCGDRRDASARIAGLFVLTLVPIAIAYQIAHYLSFLAMAWQYLIPLASDPFGLGWNLFGTANYFVRIGIIDARLVWIVSVVVIVAGHIAALILGHLLSMREFADRRAAIRSQWPMLVLMVGYTMLSLWIIAQPIVTSR